MAFTQKMFQKRWLIPVWVVQLIGLGIYFILACVGLSLTDNLDDSLEDYGYSSSDSDDISNAYRASYGVIVGFTSVCLLLIFVEIGLAAAHKLKPTFHLVSAVIKAVIGTIWLIIVCIGSASVGRGYALNIVLSLAITVSTLLQVVYGSVLVHRVRKGYYNNSGSSSRGEYGAVAYKGQGAGDVELQAGGVPVYR